MKLNNLYYNTPWSGVNVEFEVNWNLLADLTAPKDAHKDLPMKVIFNYPATIIYWEDGTKTVVKCGPDDEYDPEKGVALCFMKKALGNKGNYNNVLRDALKSYKFENGCTDDISLTHPAPDVTKLSGLCESMADAFRQSLGIKSPSKGDGTGDF